MRRVLLISVLVLLLLIAGGLVWLTSSSGERFLKRQAENAIENAIGFQTRIGDLSTNLFSSLELREVNLQDIKTGSIVRIPYVKVDYKLFPLIHSDIKIDSVLSHGLTLRIDQQTIDSFTGGAKSQSKSQKPPKWQIHIGYADISSASITYSNLEQHIQVNASGLRAISHDQNRFDVTLDTISGIYQNKRLVTMYGRILASQANDEWHLDSLRMASQQSEIIASGYYVMSSGEFELQHDERIGNDLIAFLQGFLPAYMRNRLSVQPVSIEGKASATANGKNLAYSAKINSSEIQYDTIRVQQPSLAFHGNPDTVIIDGLTAQLGKTSDTLNVSGYINRKQKSLNTKARISLTSLDYVQHFFPMDSSLDAHLRLRFDGTIPYNDPLNSRGKISMNLTDLTFRQKSYQKIRMTAQISDQQVKASIQQTSNTLTLEGSSGWPLQISGRLNINDYSLATAFVDYQLAGSTDVGFDAKITEQGEFNIAGKLSSANELSRGMPIQVYLPFTVSNSRLAIKSGTARIADLTPDTLHLDLQYQPTLDASLTILEPKAEGQSQQGELRAKVASDSSRVFAGKLDMTHIAIQRWLKFATDVRMQPAGAINMTSQFRAGSDSVNGTGILEINSARFSSAIFDSTMIRFKFNQNGLTIREGKSQYQDLIANIKGYVPFNTEDSIAVSVSAQDLPLDAVNPFLQTGTYLQGTITPNLKITGTLNQPRLEGKVTVDSAYIAINPRLAPMQSVSAAVKLQGRGFDIQYIKARYNDFPLTVTGTGTFTPSFNGSIDVKSGGSIDLQYPGTPKDSLRLVFDDIPMELFQPYVPHELAVAGKLNGQISGINLFDSTRTLLSDLNVNRKGYDGGSDYNFAWQASLENQIFRVDESRLDMPDGSARFTGVIPIHFDSTRNGLFANSDTIEAHLIVEQLGLSQFTPFVNLGEIESGVVRASVDMSGKLANPDINGQLFANSISITSNVQKWNLDDGNLAVRFEGDSISVEQLTAKINSVPIDFTGQVAYSPEDFRAVLQGDVNQTGKLNAYLYNNYPADSLNASLDIKNLRFGDLLSMQQMDRNLKGGMNLHIDASGSRTFPVFDIAGSISDLQMEKVSFQQVHLRSSYRNRRLQFDSLYIAGTNSEVSVTGAYPVDINLNTLSITPVDTSYSLNLQIQNFPMNSFEAFTAGEYNLTGNLNASAKLSSNGKTSSIDGYLEAAQLAFSLPYFDQKAENGDIRFNFSNRNVRIAKGQMTVNQTPINFSGNLDLTTPEQAQYNVTVSTDKLSLSREGEMQFTLAPTNLQLTSKKGQPVYINGEVQFASLKYTKPVQNIQLLSLIGTKTVQPPQFTQNMLHDIRLDLAIRLPDNGSVENNIVELNFTADIQLSGPLFQPRYTGRIQSNSGKIYYLGKTFNIEQAAITFGNNLGLNPDLNITASTVIPASQNVDKIDYKIVLLVTGSLHQPQVQFTAEPPTRPHTTDQLTQSDIITLLAVGRPREQFSSSSGEGNLQQVLLRQAQRFSSARISSYVEYRVGRLLDLDRVAIEGNLFNLSGAQGPTFTAQKSLSSRLTLTYSTSIGNSNVQGVRLNYELTTHWYITTETNQQEDYGIDFKYKLKFR